MAKKTIHILIVLVVVTGLVLGGLLLVKHKRQTLAAAPRYGMRPTPVRVASARLGDLRQTQDYLAVVEPIRVADISARLTTTVEKVLHDENEWVQAGDVLVTLDARQIEERIAAMKAQIEQVQADLAANQATVDALVKTAAYWDREAKRDQTLADKGTIPAAQAEGTIDKANETRGKLDATRQKSAAIQRSIASLQRQQAELKTTLSYCTIRSPFDGMVSQRRVDPGDLAAPGKSLMVVEDRSRLKLSFDVPQQDLPHIHEGLEVDYSIGGQPHTATLSHLFASLNAARMLRVEVVLSGSDRDGLSSGATVPLQVVLSHDKNVILVPATAIIESPDGQSHVFVAHDRHLEARSVTLLGSSGDDVAVKGVAAGQQVVLSTFLGWTQLASGQAVEVIQ